MSCGGETANFDSAMRRAEGCGPNRRLATATLSSTLRHLISAGLQPPLQLGAPQLLHLSKFFTQRHDTSSPLHAATQLLRSGFRPAKLQDAASTSWRTSPLRSAFRPSETSPRRFGFCLSDLSPQRFGLRPAKLHRAASANFTSTPPGETSLLPTCPGTSATDHRSIENHREL